MTESTSMKEISHTNHDAATSLRRLYARGEEPVPDGGRPATEMRAVDHAPGERAPNRVFERGGEFTDE